MSELTVYYDGACPVCAREIGFYRGRQGAERIDWIDVAAPGAATGPGFTRDAALRRIHVRRADGTLASGAAAFAEIWRQLPGFRRLGLAVGAPPVRPVAELAYRGFLRLRKLWR